MYVYPIGIIIQGDIHFFVNSTFKKLLNFYTTVLFIFYTAASSFLIYGHTIADCNDVYVPVYPPPPPQYLNIFSKQKITYLDF